MDEFDKQLEQILIHRKPEFWLNDLFSNLTEYINDDYPDYIFYKKENVLLFNYNFKTECFYYNYKKIYLVLRDKYHCNDNSISMLIKEKVEKYLKLCVKTTNIGFNSKNMLIETHFKLCVKTTEDLR